MSSIGVYIHIPYCIQRCRYCDFTTFEQDKILPPQEYVQYLLKEIRTRAHWAPTQQAHSVYFGGGTPSLIDSKLIVSIIHELANSGFKILPNAEVTLEINPATVDDVKLKDYLKVGVNRFSVGAQSFDDQLLQLCGRRHSAQQTRDTLELLQQHSLNYSFDLLFALPHQNHEQLQRDLDEIEQFSPNHISAYCLTVPEGHPMSFHRPQEKAQVEMFHEIEKRLELIGLHKYEISNFAKTGFESRHNLTYWQNEPYMSFGLSSHSYFPVQKNAPFGVRFWNPKDFNEYFEQIESGLENPMSLPYQQWERLKAHEALTDYFHMHLRTHRGLSVDAAHEIFPQAKTLISQSVEKLETSGLLQVHTGQASLTAQGQLISNHVFSQLTFCEQDLLV